LSEEPQNVKISNSSFWLDTELPLPEVLHSWCDAAGRHLFNPKWDLLPNDCSVHRLDNGVFQQDNAVPHLAYITRDLSEQFKIDWLHWSSMPLDLPPNEHGSMGHHR
jgi:hypothetical protein